MANSLEEKWWCEWYWYLHENDVQSKPEVQWVKAMNLVFQLLQSAVQCRQSGVDKYVWSATVAVQVGRRERLHSQEGKGVETIDINYWFNMRLRQR